jgi:hypothetical protein
MVKKRLWRGGCPGLRTSTGEDHALDAALGVGLVQQVLHQLLRPPVVHVRVVGRALVEEVVRARVAARRAVGRDADDAAHAHRRRGLQHVARAFDVHRVELPDAARVDEAAEVEQRRALGAAEERCQRGRVADVALDRLDAGREGGERPRRHAAQHEAADAAFRVRGGERRHVGQAAGEHLDEAGAEPAGRAGHEGRGLRHAAATISTVFDDVNRTAYVAPPWRCRA